MAHAREKKFSTCEIPKQNNSFGYYTNPLRVTHAAELFEYYSSNASERGWLRMQEKQVRGKC